MSIEDPKLTLRDGRSRKGLATVELAVCLPFLIVIVFGFIEATNVIFLKQRLTAAAYEGARKVIAPTKTSQDAIDAATAVLTQLGVAGGTVTVTPTVAGSTSTMTQITVTVKAPFYSSNASKNNSIMKPFIIGNLITNISATAVMIRQ